MSDCCSPSGYRRFFNRGEADRNLRHYRRRGLDVMARKLVEYLVRRGIEGSSVLEVGGGIGALHVELLEAGADTAINVELSDGYEPVAAALLEEKGLLDRVERRLGDFTAVADETQADVVVMHRVICCYPEMEKLMGAALSSTGRFLAVTFPRRHLGTRVAIVLTNLYCRLRGVDFRGFVHPPDEILAVAGSHGFEPVYDDRKLVWRALVWERAIGLAVDPEASAHPVQRKAG